MTENQAKLIVLPLAGIITLGVMIATLSICGYVLNLSLKRMLSSADHMILAAIFPAFLLGLSIGFIAANYAIRAIPSLRQVVARKEGAGSEGSFAASTRSLARAAAAFLVLTIVGAVIFVRSH